MLGGHIEDKTVAALGFAPVEQLVDQGEELVKAAGVLGIDGAADGGGGEDGSAPDQPVAPENVPVKEHGVEKGVNAVVIQAAKIYKQKLVPAVAPDDAALSDIAREIGGDAAEHLIAGTVAVVVVDALEIVQIDNGRGEGAALRNERLDETEDKGAGDEPCQRVMDGREGHGLQQIRKERIAGKIFGCIHGPPLLLLCATILSEEKQNYKRRQAFSMLSVSLFSG